MWQFDGSRALAAALVLIAACSSGDDLGPDGSADAALADSAVIVDAPALDSGGADASTALDASAGDATAGTSTLAEHRDRLLATLPATTCESWASFDTSQRAVFLTLTHRLFISAAPDGLPMLAHITRVYLVLGGGSDGSSCGGAENNRLFLSMDEYLWQLMGQTWDGASVLEDGGGGTFVHTRDLAGPHSPFDASIESDDGLRCALLIELSGSRPPTAQAHFFLEGSAVRVERGSGISLPLDPYMLELDQDYDCTHRSNPTCSDFEHRYETNYGDFECDWVPAACVPTAPGGCYRDVEPP